jgi:regulator of cell morphogenesis and NO signaling
MNTVTNELNLEDVTVGDIVAENYHAAGIFRKYGLDFCCGGNIKLKDACENQRIDTNRVVEELKAINWNQSAINENYQAWEPGFLIDHIIDTHHRFVLAKIEEIAGYAARVAKVHGLNHPENVDIYHKFDELSQEMQEHMKDEEEVVFPMILDVYKKRMKGEEISGELREELRNQLSLMENDHEGAGSLMQTIRNLSNDFTPPADACTTYRILYQNLEGFEKDLHKHVHLENNILFKKAEQLV